MNGHTSSRFFLNAMILAGIFVGLIWLIFYQVLPKMTIKIAFKQLLNGLTLGLMYVIIASGLSLIFGLMEVINFAHGALFPSSWRPSSSALSGCF
jgi:ABC-type branched-subunit amino acid transport system permease subunit